MVHKEVEDSPDLSNKEVTHFSVSRAAVVVFPLITLLNNLSEDSHKEVYKVDSLKLITHKDSPKGLMEVLKAFHNNFLLREVKVDNTMQVSKVEDSHMISVPLPVVKEASKVVQ